MIKTSHTALCTLQEIFLLKQSLRVFSKHPLLVKQNSGPQNFSPEILFQLILFSIILICLLHLFFLISSLKHTFLSILKQSVSLFISYSKPFMNKQWIGVTLGTQEELMLQSAWIPMLKRNQDSKCIGLEFWIHISVSLKWGTEEWWHTSKNSLNAKSRNKSLQV